MNFNAFVNEKDVATFVLQTTAPYNILDFDQGLCQMLGYSPQELSKKICTLENLIYVDDYTESIASINYQLSISNLISLQQRIVTKNGDTLTVLCNGQAFTLADGREVLQCVFTDITHLETAAHESQKAKTDLEIFANTVPSGLSKHLLDNNLTLIWSNNFFYKLCGYTQEEFKDNFEKSMLSLVLGEDLATVIEVLADLTEDVQSKIANFRILCKDNSIKWVNAVFARAGEFENGFPVVNLVLSDITNLKIAEMKATLEEQKYLIISDISEELPYEYDIATDTITFADKFSHIFDSHPILVNPAERMVKQGLVSMDSINTITHLFELAKTGTEYYATELKLNTKNSGFQWYYTTFSTIYDENDNPIRSIGLLRNIHNHKLQQQKLLTRAQTDLATGLYNKATTERKIQEKLQELNANSYHILMLVDIDDFKAINDTYGHLTGDEVILNIAKTLQQYQGEYGFAGRLGGDEFCLFLTNVLDTQLACEKAVKIANKLKKLYPGDNDSCKVTLSIGIASTNQQIPYSVLLEQADTAVYQTKAKGKNGFTLYQDDMERAKYENHRGRTSDNTKETDDFMDQLSSTLFMPRNSHSGIEQALCLIGNSYNLDKICIWEYGFQKNYVDCTHLWCRQGTVSDHKRCQHTPSSVFEELASMGSDGITYSSDTSLIKLNSSSMYPSAEGIRKLMQCTIKTVEKTTGYIVFYSMDDKSIWSPKTLNKFKMFFRLLSAAVVNKQTQNNLTLLRDDTIKAFDIAQNPLIVVDRDNFNIMYFNELSREYYPNISLNSKCYAAMYQGTGPCRDCPLHKVTDAGNTVKCTKHNHFLDENLDIYMTSIKWNTRSNTVLLSSSCHKQTKSERLKLEAEQIMKC